MVNITSIFFWDSWSFLSFAVNIMIIYIVWLLATAIEPFRKNVMWDIMAFFISFVTLLYYTLAVVNNKDIATDFDKALIQVLWLTLVILILYRVYSEKFAIGR